MKGTKIFNLSSEECTMAYLQYSLPDSRLQPWQIHAILLSYTDYKFLVRISSRLIPLLALKSKVQGLSPHHTPHLSKVSKAVTNTRDSYSYAHRFYTRTARPEPLLARHVNYFICIPRSHPSLHTPLRQNFHRKSGFNFFYYKY